MHLKALDDLNLAGLLAVLMVAQAAAHLAGFGPLVYRAVQRVVEEIGARGQGQHTELELFGGEAIPLALRRDFAELMQAASNDLERGGFTAASALVLRSSAEGLTTEMPERLGPLIGREVRTTH